MERLDYSATAKLFASRHPALSFVGIQVTFWVVVNMFLAVLLQLHSALLVETGQLPPAGDLYPIFILSMVLGLVYGLALGFSEYFFFQRIFRYRSLGKAVIAKAAISLLAIIAIISITRVVSKSVLASSLIDINRVTENKDLWRATFFLLTFYYFFMTLLISFVNQMNNKFGPGVLVPLLLGKYKNPREEHRLFMFMDLKGSTSLAEQLGHLQYSALIQDSFLDINAVVPLFNSEIYQYVGDEIVITWPITAERADATCIRFYFECKKRIEKRSDYYTEKYGTVPVFKAGVHMGVVVAVEIGEIKKDIAYHGDTLNTASRIQSLCNEYNKSLLVSVPVLDAMKELTAFRIEKLGAVTLKGRVESISIASVEQGS